MESVLKDSASRKSQAVWSDFFQGLWYDSTMADGISAHIHFSFQIARGKQRFRELIIYVSKKSERDYYFGATKLNKILYHADFRAFERLGQPITGMVYFRLPNGPAPQALIPVRRELINEGAIKLEQVELGQYIQDRTIALRDPVVSLFTEDELLIVDSVIEELWNQNAGDVSDASHDVRWRVLRHQDKLPYEFAFLVDSLTQGDIEKAAELAERFKWPSIGT
jgi:hypothetical protein